MSVRLLFVGLSAMWFLSGAGASLIAHPVSFAPPVAAGTCRPILVELDTASWNVSRGTFLGRAVGQTFYAPETLLSRITLWRPPWANFLGAHLFVTEVDEGQNPPRPDSRKKLLDGPTIHVYDSDPPGQLVEMSFELDPPLALPRRGLYAFFIQTEYCDPGEIRFVADTLNPYKYGISWLTGRALTVCALAPVSGGEDNADFIFRLEFCDATTPVKRRSWGQVRSIYR